MAVEPDTSSPQERFDFLQGQFHKLCADASTEFGPDVILSAMLEIFIQQSVKNFGTLGTLETMGKIIISVTNRGPKIELAQTKGLN